MATHTAQEIRRQYETAMGPDLGARFYYLHNLLLWTKMLWLDYCFLFKEKKERLELLNKAAPFFFYKVQKLTRDTVFLNLSKLTDRSKMGENENVSFESVLRLLDQDLQSKLQPSYKEIAELCHQIRERRHKFIGHLDFIWQEKDAKAEIKPIPTELIEEVFMKMEDCFNQISRHYLQSTRMFTMMEPTISTRKLLYVIHDGLVHDEEFWERQYADTASAKDEERKQLRL